MNYFTTNDVADYMEIVYGDFNHRSLNDCLEILRDLLNGEISVEQVRQTIIKSTSDES